ncbi:MAG: hypothetical protein IRY99_28060 [Isosphaeraceae bacterium]|nr:hypothetical protein [Isosphaeraceae bacterium]
MFRHQFKQKSAALRQQAKGYYLTILDEDPPVEFLKRFETHTPPVTAGSKFKEGQGVKFRIESLKWIDDDTAELRGGYYEGPLSASYFLYRVNRKNGRWIVTKAELRGID